MALDQNIDISSMPKKNGIVLDIPFDWAVRRFHDIFLFYKGLNITKQNLKDEGVPCVNYGEIHSKYGFEIDPDKHPLKCVDESYIKENPKSLLVRGDIIYADTSEDIQGSGNFSQLISNKSVFAGYHTLIARPNYPINHRYIAYMLDSKTFRNQITRLVKGVKVFSITQSLLRKTKIWFPETSKQTAIANFLDKKTAQIDEAIAIKEKQIELLKERKQLIIQKAVTQGLDPNVTMKDSGVDWIGEIPEHWEVKRLKYVLKERADKSKHGLEPLFMMSQVYGLVVRSDFHKKAEVAASGVDNKLVYKNDLVFNKLKAHLGVFFKSTIDNVGSVSPDYAVYECKTLSLIHI